MSLKTLHIFADMPSVQPPAETAAADTVRGKRALYAEQCRNQEMLRRRGAKSLGLPVGGRYIRAMQSVARIFTCACLGMALRLSGASAQNQNAYGLSDLKPYDGAPVAQPPLNGLATVMQAEKPPPRRSPKDIGEPAFTIHAVGGVMIDSTIGK